MGGLRNVLQHIGGTGGDDTTGLVDGSIGICLIVRTVQTGVLDVLRNLLHALGNLPVQFADGVRGLPGNVSAAQSAHVAFMSISRAYGLMEDLAHIGLLRAGNGGCIGGSSGCRLGDGGLRSSAQSVGLVDNKLNAGADSALTDGVQEGGLGVALGVEQTRVVGTGKRSSKCVCHV